LANLMLFLQKNREKTMEISYRHDITPTAAQVIELYDTAGLPRPTSDSARIQKMIDNADLIVTAWVNDKLIGLSRSITDWVWCCYLADLAVLPDSKKTGIGRKLIELTKQKVGEQSMVLLLSVPTAMEYYPKVGFEKVDNGFIIFREK
jgi:N-acetylglutamate synthase-like GNAT family acetyltransferase